MTDHQQRCDWCHEVATRITHHDRPNAGPLTAYWCERHYRESDHDINDPDHHPYHCPACPEFGLPCPDCPVHKGET